MTSIAPRVDWNLNLHPETGIGDSEHKYKTTKCLCKWKDLENKNIYPKEVKTVEDKYERKLNGSVVYYIVQNRNSR